LVWWVEEIRTILFFILLLLTSCIDADERLDDGYAVGFNTTCKIRATLVEGDWDNKDYKRGYASGYRAGSFACRNSKKDE